jgi:hypothetical protein
LTATTAPAAGLGVWRLLVIGLVGVLAVGIGATAGAFLLTGRAAGAGEAARYVPASAPLYVELRLDPGVAQDEALRELLGRFPEIEGVDLTRPLFEQLGEAIDEELAAGAETDLRWETDVAPWFDGAVTFAVTEIPVEAFDPSAMEPPADLDDPSAFAGDELMPGMLVTLGVTDPAAARASIARLVAEEAEALELTETEHRGVTIVAAPDEGAYAVTDDAVLVAPDADAIVTALDTAAAGVSLADADHITDLAARLPADWLALFAFDFTDVMAAAMDAQADDPSTSAMRALIEGQPMRGATVITAEGDRLAIDGVAAAPTGDLALENTDRGLAAEVPADTLYFADGGNIGRALASLATALKDAAQADPEAAEQIRTAEAALGADLEEMVAWIDDGAIAAGWSADGPWGGLVLVPSDVDAAERRLGQLATFAGLAALDPSSGISVDESEVAGETVTTIRWQAPASDPSLDFGMQPVDGLSVQYTVTEDRAIIGIGEAFVADVLELADGDALADEERYTATIDALGGADNAGTVWVDLAGTVDAIVTAIEPMMPMMDPEGEFAASIEPWLRPFDRYAAVSVVEGDVVVQRAVVVVE